MFPYEASDALYSAMATMPALESIALSNHTRPEDESALADPESLTELLRVPSLRNVCFDNFYFTGALCQATANALIEGTAVTKLELAKCISLSEESAAIKANGLSRNTSVTCINVMPPCQETLYNALAAALPSNSTLRHLNLGRGMSPRRIRLDPAIDEHFSPIISALGQNSGLKTLVVDLPYSNDESLCAAMQKGLEMNETLESLELKHVSLCDGNAEFWCKALSFLRTNKALKSLVVDTQNDVTESCLSAFRIDIAGMLTENTSLKSLSVRSYYAIKAEVYVALITALQQNTTLKILLTDDEDKQMAVLLMKNYALTSLPGIDHHWEDMSAILRLNEAGRRYLIEDGFFISKGVDVFSAVSNEINCVFLHLLESPRLCDRSAVEVIIDFADETAGFQISESGIS